MFPSSPRLLAIPELVLLILEHLSDGRSLVHVAITCHFFADIALPLLWKTKTIHLEFLYCLLPESARSSLSSRKPRACDWPRYLYYSEHVRTLHMSTCFFSPNCLDPPVPTEIRLDTDSLVQLLTGPSHRIDVTFKRIQSITYFPTRHTWKNKARLLYPSLNYSVCNLLSRLPNLRTLQLGSHSSAPAIRSVFTLNTLQSLVLNYQDVALIEVLAAFRLPRVTRVRLCQSIPWSTALGVFLTLGRCCPSLEELSVESSHLACFARSLLPTLSAVDVFAALAESDLVHFKLELQSRILLPRSLYEWRPIANRYTGLRSFVLNTGDHILYNHETSVDLDVVVFLVSSLPLLEVLIVPIIVVNEPSCRISKDTYIHPLHTLGSVFGDPILSWTRSIVECLTSIRDYAPNVYDVEDGEDRPPGDTWRLVRTLFLGLSDGDLD